MALLELLIVETVASSATCFGLRKVDELAKRRDALMVWKLDAVSTPIVDPWLEKLAGTPQGKRETYLAEFVPEFIRTMVNRKAFDHVVHGIVNSNSGLRQKFPAIKAVFTRLAESKLGGSFVQLSNKLGGH